MVRFKNKLMRTEAHLKSYNQQVQDLIDQGIFSVLENEEQHSKGTFLPCNIAINSSSASTPIRVVQNGSFSSGSKPSLNSCMLTGSPGNRSLADILVTLRFHQFLAVGDLRKAYMQIGLGENSQPYLKILHRRGGLGSRGEITVLEGRSLFFGLKSSQAIFSLCKNTAAEMFIKRKAVKE